MDNDRMTKAIEELESISLNLEKIKELEQKTIEKKDNLEKIFSNILDKEKNLNNLYSRLEEMTNRINENMNKLEKFNNALEILSYKFDAQLKEVQLQRLNLQQEKMDKIIAMGESLSYEKEKEDNSTIVLKNKKTNK